MDTKLTLPVAAGDVGRKGTLNWCGADDGSADQNPIRKQSPEARRQYMREYMREYRRRRPGLSTPYVRKYRARMRTASA